MGDRQVQLQRVVQLDIQAHSLAHAAGALRGLLRRLIQARSAAASCKHGRGQGTLRLQGKACAGSAAAEPCGAGPSAACQPTFQPCAAGVTLQRRVERGIQLLPCLGRHLPRLHAAVARLPIVLHPHSLAVHSWQRQVEHQWEALLGGRQSAGRQTSAAAVQARASDSCAAALLAQASPPRLTS